MSGVTPIPANEARFDVRVVVEATAGHPLSSPTARVARGVTTDSRAVVPGCAFIALRGERHDGHTFVAAAISAGAVLVVVERGRAPRETRDADVVEVDDTLAAWGALARAHLRRCRESDAGPRVVGITGSAGKTTTKELCAALLRTAGPCHAGPGNLNNRVGVPAVAFGVEPWHRFAIFEMGMSVPGEIAKLAAIAEPNVGVITNIGLAHAAGVGGRLSDVAREKGALFESLRTGVAVANLDDPAVVEQLGRAASARVVTFGSREGADYQLVFRQPRGALGSVVTVRRPKRDEATFSVPIPGHAAAMDFVAALAASEAAAGGPPLDSTAVERALLQLPHLSGRMHVRALRGRVIVLDDAYNASPVTVRAAFATLGEVATGRRVAVLGEMKDLGPSAEREHEALGAAAAEAGIELLVSCGGLADATGYEAQRRGVAVVFAHDVDTAAQATVDRVRPGDAVLVKASRSVGAERVIEALLFALGEEAR